MKALTFVLSYDKFCSKFLKFKSLLLNKEQDSLKMQTDCLSSYDKIMRGLIKIKDGNFLVYYGPIMESP